MHRHQSREIDLAEKLRESSAAASHFLYCFTGICVALVWTGVGCAIALIFGAIRQFLGEWRLLQGLFLIALGTWLVLIIRSGALACRASALTYDGSKCFVGIRRRWLRLAVVVLISVAGTTSLIIMGFDAKGALLWFMWFTCGCICIVAAIVTFHAIDIMVTVDRLQDREIKVFRYSPARTQELRRLVSYFTSFTFLMTLGYACALAATLEAHWTGNRDYIAAVRLFWPVLYVPACSIVMVYPHVVVHRLIRREKERTLLSYERQMDELLTKYGALDKSEIERTNAMAQMFDRITATPNYVVDFGIAVRALLPLAFNLITLFAKALVHQS